MTAFPRNPERLLLAGTRAALALALLVPLAWAPWTLYPVPVGKAALARTAIAVAFALWAALALRHPQWRPPRSALLAALAAWLAVAVLSAMLGVSPQHGLWSTYSRLQGAVNAAHWVAFAVILASVTRTPSDWMRVLNFNLAVGLAVSALAILRYAFPGAPLPLPGGEAHWPRIGAGAGNPILLGAYLQMVALLAIGMFLRSLRPALPPAMPESGSARAARRRVSGRPPKAEARQAQGDGWGLRSFHATTALAALAGVALTGSLGSLAGLAAGLGAASFLHALYGRSRHERRLGIAGLCGVVAVALTLVLGLALRGPDPAPAFANPMLERATSAERVGHTLGNRLRNWEAGLRAFAERPLLGWGTGNYFVASARHLPPPEGRAKVRDHAHNILVEEAAERGLAGLVAWSVLWGLTALAVLRAVRRAGDPGERATAAFAGAALAGWLVQGLTSFYSAETWLQHMLLLAFLVHPGAGARRPDRPPGKPASGSRQGRMEPVFPTASAGRLPAALRLAAGVAAAGLAAASVASSAAIVAGAAAMWRADNGGDFIVEVERAIAAFPPLATGPRIVLFNNLAFNWDALVRHDPDEATRLLALAEAHAAAALAAEPESWVLHHALARLRLKVAATWPGHEGRARFHLDRSRELAPNLDPLEAPLPPGRGDGR